MKGFLVILACLVAVLLAAFHPQLKHYAEQASSWVSAQIGDDPCSKEGREAQQACAEQQNHLAGKIDPRLDMSDQQRTLNKVLEK